MSTDFHFSHSAPVSAPKEELGAPRKQHDDLLAALQLVKDIASGSTTANSLPHLARIAGDALAGHPAAADAGDVSALLRDMLAIQEACGLHTDEYAPGSVIEYIKELEGDRPAATSAARQEPERLNTDQSREYLVKFMEQHFTDKTFHRYIRGERDKVNLAGDFAWQMARALRLLEADRAAAKGAAGQEGAA